MLYYDTTNNGLFPFRDNIINRALEGTSHTLGKQKLGCGSLWVSRRCPAAGSGFIWTFRVDMDGEKKSSGCTQPESSVGPTGSREEQLSLISWNIDGLDGDEQPERARSLCSYLTEYSADVVLLQEMVQPYMRFMHRRLGDAYNFIEGGQDGYFTMMLLKKSRLRLLDHHILHFSKSRMMRNLLVAQVEFGGQKLSLMTSHFESCKANSAERMRQLRLVMKMMSQAPDDHTVLFGGDTNLRDHEVAAVGLPGNVVDLWEQLGEPEKCRYTWDTRANTNKDIPFKCRFRFDRVYLRRASGDGIPQLEPHSMALIGLEKLRCGLFTSDHWGIYSTFSVTRT